MPLGRADAAIMAAIAAAVLAAFWPAVGFGFLAWDDAPLLVGNYAYRGLGLSELRWMFTNTTLGHYNPLTWLSHALEFRLFGLDPRVFHLNNLLLHAATACAFYLTARRLLAAADPKFAAETKRLRSGAALAALLFAIHPLRVESVAWVTERRDVLSGVFYVGTVLAYLEGRRGAAVLLYALSLGSKAIGLTLPAALLILDVYPLGRLPAGAGRARALRGLVVEKWPFWTLAALFAGLGVLGQSGIGVMYTLADIGPAERLARSAYNLLFYPAKTLVPVGLSPLYELVRRIDPFSATYVLSALGVAGLTAALWAARRRFPAGLASWAFYVVTILPVVGLLQGGVQSAADRYSYLACLPLALLGGALLAMLRVPGAAAGALLVLALGAASRRQTMFWRDDESLWLRVLAVAPDTVTAHFTLGEISAKRGDAAEAEFHYRRCLKLNPRYVKAYGSLAQLALSRGDEKAAWEHFLKSQPSEAKAQAALGRGLAARGRAAAAASRFERALALEPGDAETRVSLAQSLVRLGRAKDAEREFREALSRGPRRADAVSGLAVLLAGRGRLEEALPFFDEAAKLEPWRPDARYNLGEALAASGRVELAVPHWRDCARREPAHAGCAARLDLVTRP